MTEGIKISDINLFNPPISWEGNSKLVLEIKYNSKAATTMQSAVGKRDQDNNRIIWDESFVFAGDITGHILLTFTVRSKRALKKNITVGSCEHQAINLLEKNSSGFCKLDVVGECHLTFNIRKIPALNVVSEVIGKASAGLGNLPILEASAEAANVIIPVAQFYNDNEKTWLSFLDTFKAFMKVMDSVSEINIYVQSAWSVLSIIPKTILAKKNRDDKVKQLCEKLKDIYEYIIMDAERLRELITTQPTTQSTNMNWSTARWSTILPTLIQQTIECAHFIKAYGTENTGIWRSMDGKIQAFNDKLDHLIKVMTDSVNLETGIITLRVSEKISEQNELTLLGDLPYDPDAGFFSKKRCFPGTRQTLIKEILEWINNDSDNLPQILVLSGQAGVGKSSVAHTIAGTFQKQNRLGSMFCFNRSFPDRRNCLFSTISRDLADTDTLWRNELVKVIDKSAVRKKKDVETQFEELILKPSENVTTIGSVVIVVDALDESGDRTEREEVLDILFNRWTKLPKNYRMVVTTRPEQDIEAQCQKFNIPCKRMGDVDAKETRRDIKAYLSNRLDSISSTLDGIDENWRDVLTNRAEGLFQWAQTACQFINPTTQRSQIIKKKWKICISDSSSSLYGLYRQIISNQSEAEDDDFVEDFRAIVGAIITAQEPLSIDALQNIFDDIEDIKSILNPFGSFFVGVHDSSTPVRPVHTSLFDFFISRKIAKEDNEYYIDTLNQSRITLGCLKLMNRMLCFNICRLETSHQFNEDVPDFDSRVKKAIPPHLSYSCRFWAFHLQWSARSEKIIREVRELMDDHLMYYFEALSLLKAVQRGRTAMQEIADRYKDVDGDLVVDALDALGFATDFGDIMMTSTPHLYISALPFAPRDSFVSRKYLEKYPGLITFNAGQPVGSSRKMGLRLAPPFTWFARSFAFCRKANYVAFASAQYEVRIMNYITKEQIVTQVPREAIEEPNFRPSDNIFPHIREIVFSLVDELVYCCLGDSNVLVLDVWNNETSIERYEDMIGVGCYRGTISSDGRFVIWQTKEGVVLIDRTSRQIVKRFEKSYRFSAISPNGEWIALCGHNNDTVRDLDSLSEADAHSAVWNPPKYSVYMWNTRRQTQRIVPYCVLRDNNLVLTDSYIACQKDEKTIEIWELRTDTKITEIQHWSYITNFHFSPDDRHFLVTSTGMYSVWTVSTGELINRAYVDDIDQCLRFSHDSKLIALLVRNSSPLFDGRETKFYVQQWDKSIELDRSYGNVLNDIIHRDAYEIWLRGSYLILRYKSILDQYHLQISDITTTNMIIFETRLGDDGSVSVFPDEENVCVAYCDNSRGLCLWNNKEGEIVLDGSVRLITALVCSDEYLISGHGRTITIWDSCTRKLVRDPINMLYKLNSLLPVRGARFAVIYDDIAEVRDCESGDKVGETFTTRYSESPIVVSVNPKHVICMSHDGVDILDLTGARVCTIPFSCHKNRGSLNGKYMGWIDNGELKLFDVDTETILIGPSLDQPVEDFWISDDSRRIMIITTLSKTGLRNRRANVRPRFLYIWDVETKNIITKTTQCLFHIKSLVLRKRHLVVLNGPPYQCYVWDLDTLERMSTVYNVPPLAADGSDIEGTPVSNKTETLEYALMAWKKASLSAFAIMDRDGWVWGLQNELLFWVPKKTRNLFWFPGMTHIPYPNFTKLSFTNFVHGSDWTKCTRSGND